MESVNMAVDERRLEVETIEVWFSTRRQAWVVERLDADGHQVGLSHCCADEQDAASCLAEWLRAHDMVNVAPSFERAADPGRTSSRRPRRQAA